MITEHNKGKLEILFSEGVKEISVDHYELMMIKVVFELS